MIRIALVEDEAEVRAQLQGYVQRHTRQYGTEFAVTEFADGMELLAQAALLHTAAATDARRA